MNQIIKLYLEAQGRLYQVLVNKLRFIRQTEVKYAFNSLDSDFFQNYKAPYLFPELTNQSQIEVCEKAIDEIVKDAKSKGVVIPLERICEEYNLSKKERTILVFLFFSQMTDKVINGFSLIKLVSSNTEEFVENISLLSEKGSLRKNDLVRICDEYLFDNERIFLARNFKITEKAFWAILGLNDLTENDNDKTNRKKLKQSVLTIKEPEVAWENLVLPEDVKNKIDEALWQYENGPKVYEKYRLKEKIFYGQTVTMLFYGPPGTGKTATSEAIAKSLGKKIGIANYAQIYNCWVGESEKSLLKVFSEAKDNDCVLLFDEADSLFAQRLNETHSTDRMHNLMTNLLMQAIERFNGVIILTTNREFVMDKAFERR
ncbi:MAG: ATP-binding protein, partial [candidate division WOR-3 bacterium]